MKNGNEMGILQRMNVFLIRVDEGMKWPDAGNGWMEDGDGMKR